MKHPWLKVLQIFNYSLTWIIAFYFFLLLIQKKVFYSLCGAKETFRMFPCQTTFDQKIFETNFPNLVKYDCLWKIQLLIFQFSNAISKFLFLCTRLKSSNLSKTLNRKLFSNSWVLVPSTSGDNNLVPIHLW